MLYPLMVVPLLGLVILRAYDEAGHCEKYPEERPELRRARHVASEPLRGGVRFWVAWAA